MRLGCLLGSWLGCLSCFLATAVAMPLSLPALLPLDSGRRWFHCSLYACRSGCFRAASEQTSGPTSSWLTTPMTLRGCTLIAPITPRRYTLITSVRFAAMNILLSAKACYFRKTRLSACTESAIPISPTAIPTPKHASRS
jgi:hypothetical protein